MRSHLVHTTSKIAALARSGEILCARKLFDEMPQRDTVAWNAMLSGYTQLGFHQEALSFFHYMRESASNPDHFTFTATLSACAGSGNLQCGRKIHALIFRSGYFASLPVNNALIDMYGKCISTGDAGWVFEDMGFVRNGVSWCSLLFAYVNANQFDVAVTTFNSMPKRVVYAWNTMVAGYGRLGESAICLDLLRKMLEEDWNMPDQWTLSAVMNACTESGECAYGCMVHSLVIKSGWGLAVEVNNSILSFYGKCGSGSDILKVVGCNEFFNLVSWNALIDAYMKIGDMNKALLAFQQVSEKNIISWTSMISGYARNGHGEEAIKVFVSMIRSGLNPDDFALGAVLHACSDLAMLLHGQMFHGSALRSGFNANAYVGNGIVNMYAKCGNIRDSYVAFCEIINKDLISWNTMLFSFGLHGWSNRALQLFEEMVACGTKPDSVTFIGLLMTCSHSGLIQKGRDLFQSMSCVHDLFPETEHVTCMVDILSRGGYLEEARELGRKYSGTYNGTINSFEPLFGACYARGDREMGTELGEQLRNMEPQSEMSYVLLSNLYCMSGEWKSAEIVRKAMVDKRVKKMPGHSWIELRNGVTAFVAGRYANPRMEDLSNTLCILESEMRYPCTAGMEQLGNI